jgi:high-affinity iron transporter
MSCRARLLLALLALSGCSRADEDVPPEYREVAVPEARLESGEARTHGRALFLEHCALCHGERADGRGERREGFAKPPADFTDPSWRRRTNARRVFFVVREGVRGTPMPAWRGTLDDGEAWDLVAYLLSVSGDSTQPEG